MTNFDHFLSDSDFAAFAPAAAAAEKIYQISSVDCVLSCRRCLEAAVKWMYSVDAGLTLPYDTRLAVLMDGGAFRDIVGPDIWQRLKLIRQLGNQAAHAGDKQVTRPKAALCLENLYIFLDFIAYCYGNEYQERPFDRSLLEARPATPPPPPVPEADLEALMAENAALRAQLTARREEQKPTYTPKPLDISEYETRRIYIDAMLADAGWSEGRDWLNEVVLDGMPSKSGQAGRTMCSTTTTAGPWPCWRPNGPAPTWPRDASRPSSTPTAWSGSMAAARWCSSPTALRPASAMAAIPSGRWPVSTPSGIWRS